MIPRLRETPEQLLLLKSLGCKQQGKIHIEKRKQVGFKTTPVLLGSYGFLFYSNVKEDQEEFEKKPTICAAILAYWTF